MKQINGLLEILKKLNIALSNEDLVTLKREGYKDFVLNYKVINKYKFWRETMLNIKLSWVKKLKGKKVKSINLRLKNIDNIDNVIDYFVRSTLFEILDK